MYRDSPAETSLAVFILVTTALILSYTLYIQYGYWVDPRYSRFPPDIAKSLRLALYYSNHLPDAEYALKNYKKALRQCAEHGLDPFSDDVTGIKISLSEWLENRMNDKKGAAQVLDVVLKEHKKWLERCATTPEKLPRAPVVGSVIGEGEAARRVSKEEFEEWVEAARSRILLKSIQISIKLSELYAHDQNLELDKAHELAIWGIEAALKELQRRKTEGMEDGWLPQEQIGGAMETLAHSYERNEHFDLALPLFFRALGLCQDQCHMAVLMNNLAVAFAQHPPRAPYETVTAPGQPSSVAPSPTSNKKWTRAEFLDSARNWAENALTHAEQPKGDKRTPECDQACAVALVNLADISAMMGDSKQARARYAQAIKVSEENSFADGVAQAQAGLQRLSQ